MPTPGPRTQYGPLPGYRNPESETPTRWNQWLFPKPQIVPGRSPGTMIITLRGNILGAGQIRRFYRQSIGYIAATEPFSWTTSSPSPGSPVGGGPIGLGITRALRYITRSLYMAGGNDNSRYLGLHTVIPKWNRSRYVTINSGQKRMPPTQRNRISSFGSRVPPLNG